MAIRFECSACGTSLKVPDSMAGRKGKCPKCQATMVVPSAGGETEPAQPEAPPRAAESPAFSPEWGRGETTPPAAKPPTAPTPTPAPAPAPKPTPAPAPAEPFGRARVGADLSSLQSGQGCLGPRLFAGELYTGQHYYLAGAGQYQSRVLNAVAEATRQRGPKDIKVTVTKAKGALGSETRDIIAVRWSIGYGYVVCFAPGQDLFVSVRVHFVPGCLARVLSLTPWSKLEPNIFGVDDLNMLAHCIIRTVEEQLDALQLEYVTHVIGR